MDGDSFVLTENSEGQIMSGGYIINNQLLVPSMSGGKNNNREDDDVPQYAIPAGLYYIDVPYKESSFEIIYKNYDILSDDIYDNLYNNASFTKSTNESIKKNNKKNTKRRKPISNSLNKKSRKQK
jgi:hypothetical protein